MRIAKFLSQAIVIFLILVSALYAAYYFQVKKSIDRQLETLKPLVDAHYNYLYVNPFGEISLSTLTLNILGQPNAVIIDRASVRSDPLFFLQFDSRIQSGDWPENLTFAVEGLNVDFNMPAFLLLEQFAQQNDDIQLSALGCGRISRFDMTALRMMGMRQGRFDFFVNLKRSEIDQLNLQLLANMQGWADLAVDLDLDRSIAIQDFQRMTQHLDRVAFSVTDRGYNERKNQFCAMQSGMSVAEYRDEHKTLVNDWIAHTLIPLPEDLMDAYHRLADPNATLSMQVFPIDLNENVLAVNSLIDQLRAGVSISINNQNLTLDDDRFNYIVELLQQPVTIETIQSNLDTDDQEEQPRGMPGVATPPVLDIPMIVPRRYRATPAEELVNYIGHPVRFFTSFGKRVNGILLSVEGTTVRVVERVQRGTAQYPVELDTIQAPEVYR